MSFKLSRVDSEVRTLQDDLQYFIDGLVQYGDRDSDLIKQIHARKRPRIFGTIIPGTSPRIVTRDAWVTTVPLQDIDKGILWAEEPTTGITFDGMVAECWIVPVYGSSSFGIMPELHLIRANECKGVETLKNSHSTCQGHPGRLIKLRAPIRNRGTVHIAAIHCQQNVEVHPLGAAKQKQNE